MPSRVRCFLLTKTDEVEVNLRRYAFTREGDAVPFCGRRERRYPGGDELVYDFHNAEVAIAREVGSIAADLNGDSTIKTVELDDPAWPIACVCGYRFRDEDAKQENRDRLYRRSDTGELVTLSRAPAGALYDAEHFHLDGFQRNGDGMSLVCKTPAGEWLIDGPASNGPGWTRTGAPPDIVVTPSIGIGHPQHMHGWLGGPRHNEPGWLVIDMP